MQLPDMSHLTGTLLLLSHLIHTTMADYLLQSFQGKIGAGNFTYYKLTRDDHIRIVLDSKEGDADLYISDLTLTPDWENYEMKSATCGEDEVEIPVDMKRPVGIGIYGHPLYKVSHYHLHVYILSPEDSSTPYSDYSQTPNPNRHFHTNVKDDEESIIWTIFVGILKIIVDILI